MARLAVPTGKLRKYPTRQFLADIWLYVRPYKTHFWAASFLRLTADLIALYPAIAFSEIVNELSKGTGADTVHLWQTFALLATLTIVFISCKQGAKWVMYQVSERAALDAKLATARHLASLDMVWQERENSGNKLKRIERGGDAIDQVVRLWVNSYIEVVINLIGTVVVVAHFDRVIALVLVVFASTYYAISSYLIAPAMKATRVANVKEESFTGVLFELISNVRTVKLLGMKRSFIRMLETSTKEFYQAIQRRIHRFQFRNVVLSIWLHSVRLTVIGVAIANIVNGHYHVGFLVLIFTYFGRIVDAISELSDNAQQVAIARDGVARMQDITRESIDIDTTDNKVDMPDNWQNLTLENVTFSYGDKRVLRDISFTIRRGEKVGLIGQSGAGKSTLFKLLLKEREGFSGSIAFDTTPIERIESRSYFNHVAVVLQDTEVFNFSLKQNVTLASETHADDPSEFNQALRIAHVNEFVDKLPDGVDTLIGEKGFRLSGGERQRLGIARAVFKQPELLFLDEATSHLDSESEGKIQDSLQQFFKGVTAVVIAHRLSTIKQMDRILVLEKGTIIEEGTFDDLYKKKGRFRELWEKQKL